MNPFHLAEGLRRTRRRRRRPRPHTGARTPTWRLLAGEAAHLTRRATAPSTVVALAGAVAAVGVLVALGPGYPGPVAPLGARVLLPLAVVVAGIGLARSAPPSWADVHRAVRPQRLVLAVVLAAALTAVVKVGLHEMTPGPVVAAPLRWVAVLAGLGVVALVVRGERA